MTLLRVIVAALAACTGGPGILAYLVAWAIILEDDQKTAENLAKRTRDTSSR